MTATTGVVLVVLLAIEGVTLVALGPMLPVHVFVGVLLVPPVVLKLGSTGYRFLRYYTRHHRYRAAGPPHLPLRLLAPLVVASTLSLLGSGILMLALGPAARWVVTVHVASFVVWIGVIGVHVLAHLPRIVGLVRADRRRAGARRVGATRRRAAVVAALAAGVPVALVALPYASAWHSVVG